MSFTEIPWPRELACSTSDSHGSNFESCVWGRGGGCHLIHLTILSPSIILAQLDYSMWFIHSFIHLLIHSFARSLAQSFIRSFVRSFVRPLICWAAVTSRARYVYIYGMWNKAKPNWITARLTIIMLSWLSGVIVVLLTSELHTIC